MIKYLFNDKVQIAYNVGHLWWGIDYNCQQKYGDPSLFNTVIGLGKLVISF